MLRRITEAYILFVWSGLQTFRLEDFCMGTEIC